MEHELGIKKPPTEYLKLLKVCQIKTNKKIERTYKIVNLKSQLYYHTHAIITCGLYTFYPLFEVHLCTAPWALSMVSGYRLFPPYEDFGT